MPAPIAEMTVAAPVADDFRNGSIGLNVVHVGGAAPVAAADVGGERRFGGRFAALTFHGVDEGSFFTADECTGTELDFDIKAEVGTHDVVAEQTGFAGLVDGITQTVDTKRKNKEYER